MRQNGQMRHWLAIIISACLHVGFAVAVYYSPVQKAKRFETVDIDISHQQRAQAPPKKPPKETVVPEPEIEPVKRKKLKKEPPSYQEKHQDTKETPKEDAEPPPAVPPPAVPPDADEAPEEAPEEKPVFDLGDNTFALSGQGAGWNLNRSEGNTKFAGVAKPSQKSVRGSKPKGVAGGIPGGTGNAPIPPRDLSRRPQLKSGEARKPQYPHEARKLGIEGRVILRVFIDKNGRVKSVRIVKDPGSGLGHAAKATMLRERWTPPLDKKGRPVPTVITWAYTFDLTG